jgi:hypothetical protein
VEKGRSSCLGSFHITNKSSRDMAKRNTNKHRVGLYRVSAEKKNWDPLQGLPSPAPQHCTPDWKNFKSTLEQRLLGKNGSKDISKTQNNKSVFERSRIFIHFSANYVLKCT